MKINHLKSLQDMARRKKNISFYFSFTLHRKWEGGFMYNKHCSSIFAPTFTKMLQKLHKEVRK